MLSLAARFRKVTYVRYALASVGALAVDMGLFLALVRLEVEPALASAIGYSVGIVAHWLLSSRKVFRAGVAERGLQRTRQKALFVMSALVGLGLTIAIVAWGGWIGLHPAVSKLVAIVISFQATWLLRRNMVFRA